LSSDLAHRSPRGLQTSSHLLVFVTSVVQRHTLPPQDFETLKDVQFTVSELVYFILHIISSFTICILLQIQSDETRRMRWAGHVTRMGVTRTVYKFLIGIN
jgi:hypothetical protein